MSTRFLFVNKDAASSSLTRSSDKEQSSINSHVQRGRRHRRSGIASSSSRRSKLPVRDKHQPDSSSPSSDHSTPSSSGSQTAVSSSTAIAKYSSYGVITFDDGHDITLSPEQTSASAIQPDDRSPDGTTAATRLRTAQQTADDLVSFSTTTTTTTPATPATPSKALIARAFDPHDVSQLASNPIDPFRNSSIAIDENAHSLIEYFRCVYHPAVWHVQTKATPNHDYGFQTSAAEVIRNALQSDVDMYALLACMSSRRHHVDGKRGNYEVDQYLGKALAATRRFMKERAYKEPKSNEEILMVIFHLYATEGYRNDMDAARVHLRGARTIINLLGGMQNLRDPQMRELLIIGDGHLSATTLQPCIFPLEFDPGPYFEATPVEVRINTLYDLRGIAPSLRQQHQTAQHIPLAIRQLIEETAEVNWVLANADDGSPEAIKHALRWIQLRSLAVRHKLLGLHLPDQFYHTLRCALVLWNLTSTTLLGKIKLRYAIGPRLRNIIRDAEHETLGWNDHVDLTAWILIMGAISCLPGTSDQAWFVHKLSEHTVALFGSATVNEDLIFHHLESLTATFFYHEPALGADLRTLAKELVIQARHSIAVTPG